MLKALTVVALPVLNEDGVPTGETNRKEPGATITEAEWKAAGQGDEDRKAMIEAGSLSEDMDAELHPDHRPVPPGEISLAAMVEQAKSLVERFGDDAPASLVALSKLDYTDVNAAAETAKAGDTSGSN